MFVMLSSLAQRLKDAPSRKLVEWIRRSIDGDDSLTASQRASHIRALFETPAGPKPAAGPDILLLRIVSEAPATRDGESRFLAESWARRSGVWERLQDQHPFDGSGDAELDGWVHCQLDVGLKLVLDRGADHLNLHIQVMLPQELIYLQPEAWEELPGVPFGTRPIMLRLSGRNDPARRHHAWVQRWRPYLPGWGCSFLILADNDSSEHEIRHCERADPGALNRFLRLRGTTRGLTFAASIALSDTRGRSWWEVVLNEGIPVVLWLQDHARANRSGTITHFKQLVATGDLRRLPLTLRDRRHGGATCSRMVSATRLVFDSPDDLPPNLRIS